MVLTCNYYTSERIRLRQLLSLIFFIYILHSSCNAPIQKDISIHWVGNQAMGIIIPADVLNTNNQDSILKQLQVRLGGASHVSILGEYNINASRIIFTPVIPLTRGLTYEIFFRSAEVGKIKIPEADPNAASAVTDVFPGSDTLPSNLLKIYIQFSGAMQEGRSQQYVYLLDNNNDSLPGSFLELQPELWNKERTVLTLWLDPGRIKRELIPNKSRGAPLTSGETYTLVISSLWKDVQGRELKQSFSKRFTVNYRDSLSPDPSKWKLFVPAKATIQPLEVNLGEPLDHFLLQETIEIMDSRGHVINGSIQVKAEDKKLFFIPHSEWLPGSYMLRVATYLEDLAGNNLNRVFDRDIRVQKQTTEQDYFQLRFEIK